MKEQKRAWYTRINKKKTGAMLLALCMLGSVVGCNSSSFFTDDLSSYNGGVNGDSSLSDYETGLGGGSNSGATTEDYEDKDIISGGSSSGSPEDYETETPNFGEDQTPTGGWDDYIGEEEEGANMPSDLNNDPYRTNGGYSYFYHYQHSPTTMPIAAWSSPPPNTKTNIGNFPTNQITLENYQKVADAGFNTVYGLYETLHGVIDVDKTNVTNALKYAKQTGLVYYVKDSSVVGNLTDYGTDALNNYYSWYMNKDAYGGTLVKDEPGMGSHTSPFEEFKTANASWKQSKYGKTKNFLINNLPAYASAAQLYYDAGSTATSAPVDYSGANWGQFVKAYVENVAPMSYSYDFYPFRGGSAQFKNYYLSLSEARKYAAEGNVPFWVFCQVGYFNVAQNLTYAQTAIQVSTSLAYGAKGVQWFNYWHPLEFSASFTSGLVDHFGVKTIYYPMVQKINQHIAAVDDVLMQCKNVGVIQIGSSYDTIPAADKLGVYGHLSSTSGSQGDALIGCFEYRNTGKSVYYIASNSFTADAAVNLSFNGSYNVTTVKGTTTMEYANRNSITINVPAGDGVLVVVG